MKSIRILIVDDQALFRESLHALLNLQDHFEVVAEAASGEEALRLVEKLHPDIVLMDVRMPGMDGVECTRRLHLENAGCRVIMLTTFDDDEYVFEALRDGAAGYLLKDAPAEKLYEAIHGAARGESFLQPSITAKVLAEFSRLAKDRRPHPDGTTEPLTPREREILCWIASGATNREIAAHLFITEGTVKNHITDILAKLAVSDRTQAAMKARELGLI